MVDTELVKSALMKVNKVRAKGIDKLSARFVRDAAEVLAVIITHIINLSLNQDIVLQDFKNARAVPLYKKSNKTDAGNLGPYLSRELYPKLWKEFCTIN